MNLGETSATVVSSYFETCTMPNVYSRVILRRPIVSEMMIWS
jgi:hypothetical protein